MNLLTRGGMVVGMVGSLLGCRGQVAAPEPLPVENVMEPAPHDPGKAGGGSTGVVGPGQPPPTEPQEAPRPLMAMTPDSCLTLIETGQGMSLAKLDLPSGTVTNGPPVRLNGNPLLSEMTSIGVKGDDLWLCNTPPGTAYQTVHKVSLVTGAATAFAVPCQAVTASEQGIFVLSRDETQIARFDDEPAIVAGTPATTTSGYLAGNLGPATTGVLASLLQDDGVVTSGGRVPLAGFSGKIFGLSEASGGRFLISSPAPEYGGTGTVESFDATTGAALGTVATFHGYLGAAGFWGLACAQ